VYITFVRLLYLGLPLGALYLGAHGHTPVAALVGHPDAPGARRLRRHMGRAGRLLLGAPDLRDPGVQSLVASTRPDALLSFFWPRRIPAAVLSIAPRGAFGTHPSLLPRWRGPDPYFWTLLEGDAQTGVTLHRLEPTYDTGAIVAQRRIPVLPGDNAWTLARRLDRPALELLAGCADALARGEALEGIAQDSTTATLAPTPTDRDMALDWHQPVEKILRTVRASAPYPGATARLGETYVEVVRARRASVEPPAALLPAEAYATAEGVAVRAADGGVLLESVRDEDGAPVDPAPLLGLALGQEA